MRRRWLVSGIAVAGILVLHELLLRWMDEGNIIASLFAAGGHVPVSTLLLAFLFLTVRLVAVLFLPGLILGAIVTGLLARRDGSGEASAAGLQGPQSRDSSAY